VSGFEEIELGVARLALGQAKKEFLSVLSGELGSEFYYVHINVHYLGVTDIELIWRRSVYLLFSFLCP